MGEAYLDPLTDVLPLAILEEALVVRDAVHTGTAASRISFCSLMIYCEGAGAGLGAGAAAPDRPML
jgi:hypothetical protein